MVQQEYELPGSLPEIGLDYPGLAEHINQAAKSCIQRVDESVYVC